MDSMPANQGARHDLALERRSNARYPVELNVRYHTLADGPALVGIGRTLNVSSAGLMIVSEQHIVQDGSRVQVSSGMAFTVGRHHAAAVDRLVPRDSLPAGRLRGATGTLSVPHAKTSCRAAT